MIIRFLCCVFFSLCICNAYADEVIWKGVVDSNGTPTDTIPLKLREQYQIRVGKYTNLGKWIQANEQLANDACYEFSFEFSGKFPPKKFESFKNSHNISVCDGTFHIDHVYQSEPFVAEQNRIFFWIYDTNYDDNSGVLEVEVIHKDNKQPHDA